MAAQGFVAACVHGEGDVVAAILQRGIGGNATGTRDVRRLSACL